MATKKEPHHGKKPNQKLKPYLVLQYLLRESDEENVVSAPTIVDYLQAIGIDAERRSIYRDIEEINKAMLIAENTKDGDEYTLEEAEAELEEYGDEARYVIYNPAKKGFYVQQRRYELDEIRLAVESIYASKFLTEKETEIIVNLICSFVSEYQAQEIKHEVFLTDRVKTNNKSTFRNVSTIDYAIKREYKEAKDETNKKNRSEGHIPEKISFKYLKYSINDLKQQVERRQGERYIVSPYKLLLTDGNYYLLAFDDKKQEMRTYRVDRMRDVQLLGQPREGEEVFAAIDMKSYTQRVFSMYSGKQETVIIQFINPLLDAVIDRFGTENAKYHKVDDSHFAVTVQVEISDPFFGWICQFGKKAKIKAPTRVKEQFADYLDKIRMMY